MSIKTAIARTLRRLNLQGVIMSLPVFGQAVYDALSCEFDRVNDFRTIVTKSVVPNENMSPDTIEDYEKKYGIDQDTTATNQERIARIIERAQRDGNGGPDWIQDQIQKAGFDLYVILNTRTVSLFSQFSNFQFNQVQFGGSINYTDPRTINGELVVSSPNGNIGGFFENFGNFQFGNTQFGVVISGFAYPRPREFSISSDPDIWGYFFFLSPVPNEIVSLGGLLQVTQQQFDFLKKTIIQLKHTRNWAITQVEIVDDPKETVKIFLTDDLGNQLIDDFGNKLFYWERI